MFAGMPRMPRVVVLGTGGTISGAAAVDHAYRAAVAPVADLVAALPGLDRVADVETIQVSQIDSVDMDDAGVLAVARAADAVLRRSDVDGVVITHGTDTMEETAFVLHLTVRSPKPMVLVGSMRPADAISADGPANLLDGIRVAADPGSAGRGSLVVLGEQVHSGRDVCKTNTTRPDAFTSPHGALGRVSARGVVWQRELCTRHTVTSPFDITRIDALPRVESVLTRPDYPLEALAALRDAGAQGLVHVGPGDGNIPTRISEWIASEAGRGLVVVRASRVSGGFVTRNGALSDDRLGTIASGAHDAPKARLLLALALGRATDRARIQRYFDEC